MVAGLGIRFQNDHETTDDDLYLFLDKKCYSMIDFEIQKMLIHGLDRLH
jgi:hypothetical protein